MTKDVNEDHVYVTCYECGKKLIPHREAMTFKDIEDAIEAHERAGQCTIDESLETV